MLRGASWRAERKATLFSPIAVRCAQGLDLLFLQQLEAYLIAVRSILITDFRTFRRERWGHAEQDTGHCPKERRQNILFLAMLRPIGVGFNNHCAMWFIGPKPRPIPSSTEAAMTLLT